MNFAPESFRSAKHSPISGSVFPIAVGTPPHMLPATTAISLDLGYLRMIYPAVDAPTAQTLVRKHVISPRLFVQWLHYPEPEVQFFQIEQSGSLIFAHERLDIEHEVVMLSSVLVSQNRFPHRGSPACKRLPSTHP